MGCTTSRPAQQPSGCDSEEAVCCSVSTLDTAPLAKASLPPLPACHASTKPASQATSIQDLPGLLLACILSDHCSWHDLFANVPLVCRDWRDVVAHSVTPQRLALDFDLQDVQQLPSSARQQQQQQPDESSAPSSSSSSSRQATRNRRWQQRQPQAQPHSAAQVVQLRHGDECSDALLLRWLQQHCAQLHDLSLSVAASPPGSVSAAAQCQLKEQLLQALAAVGCSPCCSSSSSSSSCSEYERCDDASEEPDLSVRIGLCDGCGAAACDVQQQLQLRQLVLQLPLFEHDINLLADGICSRAPLLHSLAMIGFAASHSSRQLAAQGGFSSKHYTAINHSRRPATSAAGGRSALVRAPVNTTAAQGAPSAGHHQQLAGTAAPGAASTPGGVGCVLKSHGFITGSSLQHLMASARQLRSLTFASRALYKVSWLAPATQLQHIACCDCQLGDASVQELVSLRLPLLSSLDLSNNAALGAAGSKSVALVARLTRLTQLNISGWGVGGAGARLQPLAALQQLAELQLDGCGLVDFSAAPFKGLTALTSLSLADNPLSSAGVADACALSQLRQLDLSGVAKRNSSPLLPPAGAACWAGFGAMPGLVQLCLADNCWPDCYPQPVVTAFLRAFCPAIAACSGLQLLDVSGCKFPHKLLAALARSLPGSLDTLVLDGCVGVKRCDLEPLAHLPGLRCVSAAALNPPLRDKHCAVLARCGRLRELGVAGNDISPKGLAVLVCMPLVELDVAGNARLASAGAAAAAAGW